MNVAYVFVRQPTREWTDAASMLSSLPASEFVDGLLGTVSGCVDQSTASVSCKVRLSTSKLRSTDSLDEDDSPLVWYPKRKLTLFHRKLIGDNPVLVMR